MAAKNMVKITFAGDSKSLEAALGRVEGQAGKAAGTFKSKLATGAKVASAALLGGLVVGAKKSIDAASNLGEEMSKTGVVFGDSAAEILDWSKSSAKSMGISRRAALQATGTFGNMLVPMGLAKPAAADMSRSMVTLAGDMASFNNASPEETLDALRSGLAGETEPLRKFGVFLDAARIKQEAMNLGLSNGTGELSAAQKAQATYSLIMKDTSATQGDFARTAGSAANQTRIQAATTEDLQAKLGSGLLPVYESALRLGNRLISAAAEHTTATKIVIGVVGGLAAAILGVNVATKVWTASQAALNVVMSANPAVRTALIIAAVGTALVVAYQKSETFRRVVNGAFNAVKGAAQNALNVINGIVRAVTGVLEALGLLASKSEGTKKVVVGNLNTIAAAQRAVASAPAPASHVGGRDLVSRHAGGTVPGPRGAPRPIMALGGERVLSPGQSGGGASIVINVSALDARGAGEAVAQALRDFTRRNGPLAGVAVLA